MTLCGGAEGTDNEEEGADIHRHHYHHSRSKFSVLATVLSTLHGLTHWILPGQYEEHDGGVPLSPNTKGKKVHFQLKHLFESLFQDSPTQDK